MQPSVGPQAPQGFAPSRAPPLGHAPPPPQAGQHGPPRPQGLNNVSSQQLEAIKAHLFPPQLASDQQAAVAHLSKLIFPGGQHSPLLGPCMALAQSQRLTTEQMALLKNVVSNRPGSTSHQQQQQQQQHGGYQQAQAPPNGGQQMNSHAPFASQQAMQAQIQNTNMMRAQGRQQQHAQGMQQGYASTSSAPPPQQGYQSNAESPYNNSYAPQTAQQGYPGGYEPTKRENQSPSHHNTPPPSNASNPSQQQSLSNGYAQNNLTAQQTADLRQRQMLQYQQQQYAQQQQMSQQNQRPVSGSGGSLPPMQPHQQPAFAPQYQPSPSLPAVDLTAKHTEAKIQAPKLDGSSGSDPFSSIAAPQSSSIGFPSSQLQSLARLDPEPIDAFNTGLSSSSTSAVKLPDPDSSSVKRRASGPPAPPARRKRNKYEYVPLAKPADSLAGWDYGFVEEATAQASQRRRPRQAQDLGLVDVHSLTMSLRSRMASEVGVALNSLTLLSMAMRTASSDTSGGIAFPLQACGGLLDELVDLLEETAFGLTDDEESDEEEEATRSSSAKGKGVAPGPPVVSYRELFRLVVQEETELPKRAPSCAAAQPRDLAADGLCPLQPAELVLSLTNLLRNFSVGEENVKALGSRPRLLKVLVKVADLPLKREWKGRQTAHWPVRLSASEAMAVRKDVLETLTNIGFEIRLDRHSKATARALFSLLTFFLLDADQSDVPYFDLSATAPAAIARFSVAPPRLDHYLDLALAAFARIAVLDANRYALASNSHPSIDLYSLFETLIHLLPVSEADFQVVASEPGVAFHENLTMSLYNLAFLASTELKLRLRTHPGFIKALVRVPKRLMGTNTNPNENIYVTLCEHCISTLTILSDVGGVSGSEGVAGGGLWWGLGANSEFEQRPGNAQPGEMDRASVKARVPPRSAGSGPGRPGVLTGDVRAIFGVLEDRSSTAAFAKLAGLIDATGGKKD